MAARLDMGAPQRIMDAIEGAVVVSGYVDGDEGLHIVFQDGRALVIAGVFALSLIRFESEKLH